MLLGQGDGLSTLQLKVGTQAISAEISAVSGCQHSAAIASTCRTCANCNDVGFLSKFDLQAVAAGMKQLGCAWQSDDSEHISILGIPAGQLVCLHSHTWVSIAWARAEADTPRQQISCGSMGGTCDVTMGQ